MNPKWPLVTRMLGLGHFAEMLLLQMDYFIRQGRKGLLGGASAKVLRVQGDFIGFVLTHDLAEPVTRELAVSFAFLLHGDETAAQAA